MVRRPSYLKGIVVRSALDCLVKLPNQGHKPGLFTVRIGVFDQVLCMFIYGKGCGSGGSAEIMLNGRDIEILACDGPLDRVHCACGELVAPWEVVLGRYCSDGCAELAYPLGTPYRGVAVMIAQEEFLDLPSERRAALLHYPSRRLGRWRVFEVPSDGGVPEHEG